MYEFVFGQHGRSSTFESHFSSGLHFGLLASTVVFFGLGLFLQQISALQNRPDLKVDVSSWKWLGEIHLGFEQVDVPVTPLSVEQKNKVITSIPEMRVKWAKKTPSQSKLFEKSRVLDKKGQVSDRLILGQASATKVSANEEGAHQIRQLEPTHSVDSTEQRKLMLMHRFLAVRFLIALNSPVIHLPDSEMNTRLARDFIHRTNPVAMSLFKRVSSHPIQPKQTVPSVLHRTEEQGPNPVVTVSSPGLKARVDSPQIPQKKPSRGLASLARPTYDAPVTDEMEQKLRSAKEWSQIVTPDFKALLPVESQAASEKSEVKLEAVRADVDKKVFALMREQMASSGAGKLSQNVSAEPMSIAAAAAQLGLSIQIPNESVQEEQKVASPTYAVGLNTQTKSNVVSVFNQSGQQFVAHSVLTTQNSKPMTLAMNPSPAQQMISQAGHLMAIQNTQADSQPEVQVDTQAKVQDSSPHADSLFFEGLDPQKTPVYNVDHQMLSVENVETAAGRRGWQLSFDDLSALQNKSQIPHWPTLAWVDESQTGDPAAIPIVSRNTIEIFAKLLGVTSQGNAGFVVGKLPAGWEIALSARTDGPAFLGEGAPESYFAFLNVAPGAQLVYLSSKKMGASGSVAIPVLAGTVTYLDLKDVHTSSVWGHVVQVGDSSSDQPEPLENASVRVVGQSSAAGLTNNSGFFRFDQVVTVANYPLYVETDYGSGFTHRHRIFPDHMRDLSLYRIDPAQIHGILNQLEGGMSQDSGLVIASLPAISSQFPDSRLIPSIRSIPSSTNLVPETYSLSPEGQLQFIDVSKSETLLSDQVFRFIGVQVPEGLFVTQVADQYGNVLSSILSVASPNVVNVIGPN